MDAVELARCSLEMVCIESKKNSFVVLTHLRRNYTYPACTNNWDGVGLCAHAGVHVVVPPMND